MHIYIYIYMSKGSGVHSRSLDPPMGDPEAFLTVWTRIDASGGLSGASGIHIKTGSGCQEAYPTSIFIDFINV